MERDEKASEDVDDEAERVDVVVLDCTECDGQDQEVLRASPASWVLRCLECGHVHTMPAPRKERMRTVPVILSSGGVSTTRELFVPVEGPVAVDDEFELDGHRVLLTAVERMDGTRPPKATGRDVKMLYAILFDTVTLHYTLNEGEVTRSFTEEVVPEEEVHIGSVREVQGVRLAVKTLKSDQNRTLHRGYLRARNVRRVFADLAPEGKHPGAKVRTRRRGKGTGPPPKSRLPPRR